MPRCKTPGGNVLIVCARPSLNFMPKCHTPGANVLIVCDRASWVWARKTDQKGPGASGEKKVLSERITSSCNDHF